MIIATSLGNGSAPALNAVVGARSNLEGLATK
jgi:hypothetical protein